MTVAPRWTTAGSWLALTAILLAAFTQAGAQTAKKPKPKTPPPAPASQGTARPPLDDEIKAALKAAPSAADYPNDAYATLLDLEDATVAPDGSTTAVVRCAYKVLTESGKQLGDVALGYNSNYQNIDVLWARTIRNNGALAYLDPKDIKRTAVYAEYPLYDDSKVVRFSMPAIEVGCIVEYCYRHTSRSKVMPGQYGHRWTFARFGPVLLSRLRLTTQSGAAPHVKLYNAEKVTSTHIAGTSGSATYTWQLRSIGSVEPEPLMPGENELRPWMQISSIDSWPTVGKWFRALQKPRAVATPAIRATVAKVTAGAKTDDEKAARLYEWVATNIRYVAVELGRSAYQPHAAGEVFEKLYGDCKDKANLLITMLAEAGIQADPALLSAGDRTPISQHLPSPSAFDHCIAVAHIGGKQVWLDATATSCAYGDIPSADRETEALVVADDGGTFVKVPGYKQGEDSTEHRSTITLAADGSAEAEYRSSMRGDYSQASRAGFRNVTPDQLNQCIQQSVQQIAAGATLKAHSQSDPKVNVDPYEDMLAVHAPALAKKSGDLLMLTVGTVAATSSGTPFSKEERTWPIVQLSDVTFSIYSTVNLPDGWEVIGLPGPARASCAILEYERTITKAADGRSLRVEARCHYKPGRVPASEYTKVRECFQVPAKADQEQIVLRKKQ